MKWLKNLTEEKGYLLLENIMTLIIITILLLVVYPLITEWFVIRDKAKHEVELSRVLYEASCEGADSTFEHSSFLTHRSLTSLFIESKSEKIGVEIYDKHFEK